MYIADKCQMIQNYVYRTSHQEQHLIMLMKL